MNEPQTTIEMLQLRQKLKQVFKFKDPKVNARPKVAFNSVRMTTVS
jgi:hypothetical protein